MEGRTVELERASLRAELQGLAVVLALMTVFWLSSERSRVLPRLQEEVNCNAVAARGRGVYPMLEAYDPGPLGQVSSSGHSPLDPLWVARVEGTMLGTLFETDWDEGPTLPSGATPTGPLAERCPLLVDRARHARLARALESLLYDAASPHDGERAARVAMVMLAAGRQALLHEARAMGGFLPCNADFLRPTQSYTGATRFTWLANALAASRVPRPLLAGLLRRILATEALMPSARRQPSVWPSLARELLAGRENEVDPEAFESLLRRTQELRERAATMRDAATALSAAEADPSPEWLPSPRTTARELARRLAHAEVAAAEEEAMALAELRALALFTASVLVRDTTGAWPRSWDELGDLVPDRVRLDPFTGDEMRFTATDGGPRIWTTGMHGSLSRTKADLSCRTLTFTN